MTLADFHFSPRLRAAARKLVCAVCPDDAAAIADDVTVQLERSLRSLPAHTRAGLAAGLMTFELSAVARYGRRFSRLSDDQARAWFVSWWDSPVFLFHEFVRGIRAIIAYAYYEQPTVKRRLEFHPDGWIAEAARRRLDSYGADIRRHEAEILQPQAITRKVRRA